MRPRSNRRPVPLPTEGQELPGTSVSRRAVLATALAGIAAAAAGCTASNSPWANATGRLRIATGNRGAVFDRYGAALAAEATQVMPQVRADTVNTAGSVANVVAVVSGGAEVGFCLGDTAVLALRGEAPFHTAADIAAVTRLYDSFLQVIVSRDSPIRELGDLAGKRLVAGQFDSGTRITTTRCLEAGGVTPTDVDLTALSLEASAAALQSGRVDALAFVSGYPVPALVELGERLPLRAIDLGAVVPRLVNRYGPQYVAGPLPITAYRLSESVQTVSIKTYLLAMRQIADPLVAGMDSVIFDHQNAIQRRVPTVRQPTSSAAIFTEPIPLHPAAAAYFRQRDRREA